MKSLLIIAFGFAVAGLAAVSIATAAEAGSSAIASVLGELLSLAIGQ